MNNEITISKKSIIYSVATVFAFAIIAYITILMGPVLFILILATMIVISMETPIQFLMRQRIMNRPLSRSIAIMLAYFFVVLAFITVITVGFPPVIVQAQTLIINLSRTLKDVLGENSDFSLATLNPNISKISESIFSTTYSVFAGIASAFSILIIAVYMSLDWENIKRRLLSIFNGELKSEVASIIDEIEISIGHWVKGQLLLMLIIGLLSLAGLIILKVDFPLALALIAGLLEVVPMLGPVVALIIAGVVGFSDSLTKGLLVIALFTIIQQVENNYLVPKVMHRVSGFSPLIILIALLIGSTLFGILGAIIAVPVMMIGVIVFKHVIRYNPTKQ